MCCSAIHIADRINVVYATSVRCIHIYTKLPTKDFIWLSTMCMTHFNSIICTYKFYPLAAKWRTNEIMCIGSFFVYVVFFSHSFSKCIYMSNVSEYFVKCCVCANGAGVVTEPCRCGTTFVISCNMNSLGNVLYYVYILNRIYALKVEPPLKSSKFNHSIRNYTAWWLLFPERVY